VIRLADRGGQRWNPEAARTALIALPSERDRSGPITLDRLRKTRIAEAPDSTSGAESSRPGRDKAEIRYVTGRR
jgi:hypothetical protein